MSVETRIRTGRPEFDELYPLVRSFLERDVLDLAIDGQRIRGYRAPDVRSIWIRDYSDMIRAFRHFERDLTSTVQHFAETQAESGRIFDYFTTFPEKPPGERENWTKYVRVPVEADVEYRFVKAAWIAWQASGDDAWIRRMMPRMEKALAYILSHPWYWDDGCGLVKRAYTIDTWDFAYTAGRHDWLQFQITEDTYWGILHGDNSGYYEAFRIMAALWRRFGEAGRADGWEARAAGLRENLNRICWNGRFFTHFVKLSPVIIPGVDEAEQLSLSNPMDINRGVSNPRTGGLDPARVSAQGQRGPRLCRVVLDRSAVSRWCVRRRAPRARRLLQRRHHAARGWRDRHGRPSSTGSRPTAWISSAVTSTWFRKPAQPISGIFRTARRAAPRPAPAPKPRRPTAGDRARCAGR